MKSLFRSLAILFVSAVCARAALWHNNVLPGAAVEDISNCLMAEPNLVAYLSAAHTKSEESENLQYIGFRDLSVAIVAAIPWGEGITALGALISHIVGSRPEKKMTGIDTRTVVATMQNQKAITDVPPMHQKRNSVSVSVLPLYSNSSVSGHITHVGPFPTNGCFSRGGYA